MGIEQKPIGHNMTRTIFVRGDDVGTRSHSDLQQSMHVHPRVIIAEYQVAIASVVATLYGTPSLAPMPRDVRFHVAHAHHVADGDAAPSIHVNASRSVCRAPVIVTGFHYALWKAKGLQSSDAVLRGESRINE